MCEHSLVIMMISSSTFASTFRFFLGVLSKGVLARLGWDKDSCTDNGEDRVLFVTSWRTRPSTNDLGMRSRDNGTYNRTRMVPCLLPKSYSILHNPVLPELHLTDRFTT